jgi:hypothetical protein
VAIWLPAYAPAKRPRNIQPAQEGPPRIVSLESTHGEIGCHDWLRRPFFDGQRCGNATCVAAVLAVEIALKRDTFLRLQSTWPSGIFRVEQRRTPIFIGLGISTSRLLGIFRNSEYRLDVVSNKRTFWFG